MIDHPLQMLLGLAVGMVSVFLLRLSSPRRRRSSSGLMARAAWVTMRAGLVLLMLLAVLMVVEATRFVDAEICVDVAPGVEWCNHDQPDVGPG